MFFDSRHGSFSCWNKSTAGEEALPHLGGRRGGDGGRDAVDRVGQDSDWHARVLHTGVRRG